MHANPWKDEAAILMGKAAGRNAYVLLNMQMHVKKFDTNLYEWESLLNELMCFLLIYFRMKFCLFQIPWNFFFIHCGILIHSILFTAPYYCPKTAPTLIFEQRKKTVHVIFGIACI